MPPFVPSLLRSPFPAAPLCFACFAASIRGRAACSASLLRACRRFRAACFCLPLRRLRLRLRLLPLLPSCLPPCFFPACRPAVPRAAFVRLLPPPCCRLCSALLPAFVFAVPACSPAACLLLCCLPFCSCRAACLCPLCVSAILQRRAACLLCRFFCPLPRFCAAFGIFVPSRRFACFVGLFLRLCLPCLRRRFSACLRASFRGAPPASLLRCVSVPAAAFVSLRLIPAAAAFACAASPPAAAPACCSAPRLRLH